MNVLLKPSSNRHKKQETRNKKVLLIASFVLCNAGTKNFVSQNVVMGIKQCLIHETSRPMLAYLLRLLIRTSLGLMSETLFLV